MGKSNEVAGIHRDDQAGRAGASGCLLSRSDAEFNFQMRGAKLSLLRSKESRAMHRGLHQMRERRDHDMRDRLQPQRLALSEGNQ
jgi:hypothetical protein